MDLCVAATVLPCSAHDEGGHALLCAHGPGPCARASVLVSIVVPMRPAYTCSPLPRASSPLSLALSLSRSPSLRSACLGLSRSCRPSSISVSVSLVAATPSSPPRHTRPTLLCSVHLLLAVLITALVVVQRPSLNGPCLAPLCPLTPAVRRPPPHA